MIDDFVQRFVEKHVELIESEDWYEVFKRWYDEADIDDQDGEYDRFNQFRDVIRSVGIDTTHDFRIQQDRVVTEMLEESLLYFLKRYKATTTPWKLNFGRIIDDLWSPVGVPYQGMYKLLKELGRKHNLKVIKNGTAFAINIK